MPEASETATRSDAGPDRTRNRAVLGMGRVAILVVAVVVGFVGCGGGL